MTDPAKSKPAAGSPAGTVDEFAHIPRRRARHPLIAAGRARPLAFFLVFHGRRDLRYALSSGEPLELGAAAAVFSNARADG